MSTPLKRFSIALSFPGEHRGFVEQVAAALSSQIGRERVLYDNYYEAEFARPDLDTYLQNLYHDESELIAVFLCADYEHKEWCGLEWRAIRDLIKKRQSSSVMPLRFDTTQIPGLFSTDGYIWIDERSPLDIASVILKRLNINTISSAVSSTCQTDLISATLSIPATNKDTVLQIAQDSASSTQYNPANRIFNVPFRPKGEQVIGRDAALQLVRVQLTKGRHTAIGHTASFEGLGGLGKTQLAVEYAYNFNNEYPNGVIWINADQDISAQLTDIAVTARWIAPETEHKFKLDVALHRLRSFSDCLIIFDNVDDFAAIEPYLPLPSATPHILVTSRNPQPGFTAIKLDPLDEGQSLQLLVQEAGRQPIGAAEEDAALNIVTQLDGLPLALELAGAYLCHRSTMPFALYRDRLISDPIKALTNPYLASFTKHDSDLFRTLQVEEDVFLEEPLLAEILDLLTWSGPADMGQQLLSSLLGKDITEFAGALALGTQLKLLQIGSDEERYALHRLVREVRRQERPLEDINSWVEKVCIRLGDWFDKLREDFLQLARFEAEIDHLVAWCNNAEHSAPLHACRLNWLQAYPAYHRGMYRDSHNLVLRSQEIYDRSSLTEPKLLAHLFNDLSSTYSYIGQYPLALDYAEKALCIRRDILGELNKDTALTYNNIGVIYTQLGDAKKALYYLIKALEISRKLGENNLHTARAYNNVGVAYSSQNNFKQSLINHENSLEICRKIFGERHPQTAATFNCIGDILGKLGESAKGLEYKNKSLKIMLDLFGECHPETGSIIDSIGSSYNEIGNYNESLKFHMKALEIRCDLLGDHHPKTISNFQSVGISFENLHQYNEALTIFRRGYGLAKVALPKKHRLLEQFERNIRNVIGKMTRPGFRSKPFHSNKKKRK